LGAPDLTAATVQISELCRGSSQITCAYANIVVIYSAQSPDAAFCERNGKAINNYGEKFPKGLGMMVLISANEPPPNEVARRAISEMYISMQRSLRAAVHVVEGEGFVAAAKRSVITLMNIHTGVRFPIKVVSTPEEGGAKLVRVLGAALAPGLAAHDIALAAEATRERL
jgi:hypothetical protein